MGHPVTTNPMIIMLINMTVVFLVLVVLMYMIKAIHALDPTKPKEAQEEPAQVTAPQPAQSLPVAPVGIPAETIACIAAAVTVAGFSAGDIRVIRPLERNGWKSSGREQGVSGI